MTFDFENCHIVALKCLKNLCQIANCCQTVRKVERAKQESKQNLGSNGQTFVENTCTYFLAIRILDIILAWVVLDTAFCNRKMVDLGGRKAVVYGMVVDTDQKVPMAQIQNCVVDMLP